MGYVVVDLTPAQLEERRRQLNLAGFHAWLTPIVLLAVTYLSRQLSEKFLRPSQGTRSGDSSSTSKRSSSNSPPASTSRGLTSTLNTTYIREFGPLHIQLLGVFYFCWLVYLTTRATGNDYMHVTKAFGHVAVSQLPLQYLLALNSPRQPSPIALITGLAPDRINAYHRLFGRIVHVFLCAHAVLYMRFFVQRGLLAKRVQDRDVRLGLAAFWTVNLLALLAVPGVRRSLGRVRFFGSHVALSGVVLAALFFHVPYTRVYVAQAAVLWAVGRVLRRR